MKCEIKWCLSGFGRASVRVNETIGDGSFSTMICRTCADALDIRNGDDLPPAHIVEWILTPAKRRRKGK